MAKKPSLAELRFSRVDFYRLRGQEFFEALFKRIQSVLGEDQERASHWAKLNPYQQGVYGWWCFWSDVENGGLTQFFYNCADTFVAAMAGLLKASGDTALTLVVKQATKIYRKHRKAFQVENPWGDEGLFARMTELTKLDRPVVGLIHRTNKQLEKWLRANFSLVAVGDLGQPIDPKFTGEVETHHPNGNVFERATIRRGVLSGPYHRFFDDGTLEHTCFYAAGEISADYWPNGQPKHKTMKRGKLKVDEWYYPSGKIQKRYVTAKTGYTVEPIRMWHENGQLAEELHMRQGNRFGPWVKFFDDGSPRLQAEYGKKESLVVTNAWNDQRQQVVKNGRGEFVEDGLDIDWQYDLYHKSTWIRSYELRDGIPHGAGKTWSDGVLWSTDQYVQGKNEGLQITYYDNGRIRSRSTYRNDKEINNEDFPKFDNPRPAVLIQFDANAELYTAWKLPLLDVYPKPRNLDKLQAQLAIPAFLQEVFERNLAKAIKDDYEDLNTFDDGIGYFVMVNERGAVESVEWTGCGVCSGGSVEVYPPIIRKLKFEPGKLRGRKVRCRVYVNVTHTFVEAGGKS